jgi:hypothetical protein
MNSVLKNMFAFSLLIASSHASAMMIWGTTCAYFRWDHLSTRDHNNCKDLLAAVHAGDDARVRQLMKSGGANYYQLRDNWGNRIFDIASPAMKEVMKQEVSEWEKKVSMTGEMYAGEYFCNDLKSFRNHLSTNYLMARTIGGRALAYATGSRLLMNWSNPNKKALHGRTALMSAVHYNRRDLMAILMCEGADHLEPNDFGCSALDIGSRGFGAEFILGQAKIREENTKRTLALYEQDRALEKRNKQGVNHELCKSHCCS